MSPDTATDVISQLGLLFTTAVATYVGAWAAFRLERSHAAKLSEDAKAVALREALFALSGQYSILRNLLDQSMNPLRASPTRMFQLKPFTTFGPFPEVPTSSLLFLLETADPDVLNHAYLAERRFRHAIGVLEQRNTFHTRGSTLLASRAPDPAQLTLDHIAAVLGPALMAELRDSTEALYQAVDDAVDQNRSVTSRLEELLATAFPRHKRLRIVPLPPKDQ